MLQLSHELFFFGVFMIEKNRQQSLKEALGWLSFVLIMLLFPALFFTCVFIPKWFGWWDPSGF